jgi:hypothetical protein
MKNTPITTMLNWTGFDFRVRMASELMCPHCFRSLRPSAVSRETDAINLICEHCHRDVICVELSLKDPTP